MVLEELFDPEDFKTSKNFKIMQKGSNENGLDVKNLEKALGKLTFKFKISGSYI